MTKQPEALRLADVLETDWHHKRADHPMLDAAAKLRRLHAALEREKSSRQAAQIENEDLKALIARSGVEQQRAVLAEREACARVCDERAMKNEHACEGLDDEDATSLRSAAWQMSVCAAAIRARGAAAQQEGEAT